MTQAVRPGPWLVFLHSRAVSRLLARTPQGRGTSAGAAALDAGRGTLEGAAWRVAIVLPPPRDLLMTDAHGVSLSHMPPQDWFSLTRSQAGLRPWDQNVDWASERGLFQGGGFCVTQVSSSRVA